MPLKEYQRKRDFKITAEPKGKVEKAGKERRFVIQKHAASHLHYDFRLEIDGTLKSWAVPKGIPFAKGEKRLAVEVEDHPVSYIDFEGTIPAGQYGGGTVMVWDRGTFTTPSASPSTELAGGKLHFILAGKKLRGEWYLVRLHNQERQWLLIRAESDFKPVSKKMDDTSALSGKTMAQLAEGKRVWNSSRVKADAAVKPAVKKKDPPPPELNFIEPMKARLVATAPAGEWIYEIKLDGFRALALKEGNEVRLLSRNEKDLAQKFPEVRDSVGQLKAETAILDGEIVALDAEGRSSFQLLQAYDIGEERPALYYYIFDLLHLNGRDLRGEPLKKRKETLAGLLRNPPESLRFSVSLEGDVDDLLEQASKLHLEGLIGKRKDSIYETGSRSGAWIKLKLLQEQEMVIGGYTPPQGSRTHIGALLVGYYDKTGLQFAGKVGTGFNDAWLRKLHGLFDPLDAADCPFQNLPEKKGSRYSVTLTASEMKKCHWLKPEMVCQVKFSEWTRDGKLRQPVFLGLREDKQPRDVVRETPA